MKQPKHERVWTKLRQNFAKLYLSKDTSLDEDSKHNNQMNRHEDSPEGYLWENQMDCIQEMH